MLLGQVCRLHYARAHALLEEVGLYRGQPPLLYALWKLDGQTHGELATRLHVQPATMTRMVRRMAGAGFVERRSDPRDERVSRVYLTDRGRAIRSEVEAVWTALEAETFAGVAEGDRDRLGAILLQVRQNLIGVTSRCGDR
jgi:DNA-binding MarR family transcriptional regulator